MSFSMLDYILCSAAAVFVYMTVIFVIALFKKDNSVVDIAWGLGFVLVALLTIFLEKGFTFRQNLVTALVLIWGVRLAVHIFIRNRGRGEDFRYAQWRKEWGKWFLLRSFFQVFMLQGILLLIVSYPVILVLRVSGVTMLEKKYAGNKEFQEYAKRTNAFFPWFPKKD